ncbi:DNA (cytosine-5-)-methyltransferase [Macrococcoides caseolyticum]|uniref:DNA (cytosine-5-)-methyltransferase n=1 Tax=Macrococcoides TaxID=3076173 RepID=UPI000C32805E|nr:MULTISPECIES: DNA (cytosine-5-)-methyltransferase [Macrococcus]PKE69701.1 DNA (cytosine-5-)-methyltransferase [Macrococcus caseolyticus]TDL38254.1 DNA (cytosine-5-)-methyltransferase [Macrococcus bohemicus]
MKKIKVAEMFAGVGGFRLGLENTNNRLFEISWANQWEPSTKVQHAFDCYTSHFTSGIHSNVDITKVTDKEMTDTNVDMIVGGFPCQDYSVARSLNGELGIAGKKGVLFWEIVRFIQNTFPKYILLENVDRLLKSPSSQRGRDFGVMLSTLNELGYDVEWRVINAAEYGYAQRRRRVFIFAYRRNMLYANSLSQQTEKSIVLKSGLFANCFKVENELNKNRENTISLSDNIVDVSEHFKFQFWNSGIMRNGRIYTADTKAVVEKPTTLADIIEKEYDSKYILTDERLKKFQFLRGGKKIERTTSDGHKYYYSEGGMSPTDSLDLPGRTMLTSEGTVNRSTHIIEIDNKVRLITPVEAERLNGFPDNWTNTMPERARYFTMGNALVVPLITRIGNYIEKIDLQYSETETQIELF